MTTHENFMYFMWHKSETFDKFKLWKVEVEKQTGRYRVMKSSIASG